MRKEQSNALVELNAKGINLNPMKQNVIIPVRDNQYLFLNEIIESAKSTDGKVDVLEALMNAGKSYLITTYLVEILKASNTNTLFLTSYYSAVVDQFANDVLAFDNMKLLIDQLNGKSLCIFIDRDKNEIKDFNRMCASSFLKTPKELYVSNFDAAADTCGMIADRYDYTIIISSLHSASDVMAPNMKEKVTAITDNKNPLIISDECHAGTPTEKDSTITYEETTGYTTIFNGTFMTALRDMSPSKIILISATPTAAHTNDSKLYNLKANLVNKAEVLPYGKKVRSFYSDDFKTNITNALTDTVNLNTKAKAEGKGKSVCVIVLPNNSKGSDIETMSYIREEMKKLGISRQDAVTKFFGTSKNVMELNQLTKSAHSNTDPLMVIVVKRKFAAGVNIKNITAFVSGVKNPNIAEIYRMAHQLWARAIRLNSLNNNITTWNDITSQIDMDMNTVSFYLGEKFRTVFVEFGNTFAEVIA